MINQLNKSVLYAAFFSLEYSFPYKHGLEEGVRAKFRRYYKCYLRPISEHPFWWL